MSFITYSSNFKSSSKFLKFYKETISLVNGVKMNPKMDLSDIKINYDQWDYNSFILGKNVKNKRIDLSSLGNNVIMVVLKATYDLANKELQNNYVNYVLDGDLSSSKIFSNLLILTGTENRPVPTITLSNPSNKYAIRIEVLYIGIESVLNTETADYDLIITGLSYNSIRTLTQGESVGVYDQTNNIVQSIQLSSINSINLNGYIVEIDDTSTGIIALQFNTEYDSRQFFSAINWLYNDQLVRYLPQPADNTSPVITYKNTIINDVAPNTTLSTYTNGFTYNDAIILCINYITDNRDGNLNSNELIVEFSQGDIKFSKIVTIGTYFITFKISDMAGNETIKVVQVTFI